jgi:type II secretory ATPase GspE/PulE/Tfp pilus assembly ATPase PilB-like protein
VLTPAEKEPFLQNDLEPPNQIPKPVGCDNCYHSGYRGRIGIYEVITVNRQIEELIFTGALQSTIEEVAVKAGTSLMFKQALKKVINQISSLEEVYRVVAHA